jgi:ElaB/YqjD/DUF883 family membrane-anchored ribosome-binding protein
MEQPIGENPRVTERMAKAAHESIDRVQEKAAKVEDQLRDAAARARGQARESGAEASAQLEGSIRKLTTYIEQNPLMAAGAAFTAGLLVSLLLRRR